MLSYEDVQAAAGKKGMTIKNLTDQLDMSPDGFKKAMRNLTLQSRYVNKLCDLISVSPNELFGYGSDLSFAISQIGNQNNQTNYLSSLSALEKQLEVKDAQIDRLLNLLSK